MPRNISPVAKQKMNDVHSDAVFLWLLTLQNQDIAPIFVVNNNENITSNGQEFIAYPFELVLFDSDGDKLPTMRLSIDNVDRDFLELIIGTTSEITVTADLIEASQPDVIEMSVDGMSLHHVNATANTISGTLVIQNILNTRYPRDVMSRDQYSGLYN